MLTQETATSALTTAAAIETVFRPESHTRSSSATETFAVHTIPQAGEPRWIIVGEPRKALPVLRSWAPWNLSSRMRWSVVIAAAAMNALRSVPGVETDVLQIDTSYWRSRLQQFPDDWNAVLHVGSSSHTRKAILFLIRGGRHVVCAAKIPLVPLATDAIMNEAAMLDSLKRYEYLPKVLFRDCDQGIAAQSWLEGRPVGRGFTSRHLDLLASLHVEGTARVSDVRSETQTELDTTDHPFDRLVLDRALEFLDCDLPLPRFIEHRDFAPWNLKWLRGGGLGLLDWEWGHPNGLPWQDACRFFYLDDVHFRGHGRVWDAITTNALLEEYRRRFEIPREALPALTMRYLLREFLMEWQGGNRWLADYAFAQIRALIEAVSPVRA